jgi:ACS family hexuronate transporter-like MFS transporter
MATTVNYVDRQVLGLLKPGLADEFKWTETDFGIILGVFSVAYALGYMVVGRMMDRWGERKGFTIAVILWSTAAMAHGLVEPLVTSGLPWMRSAFAGTFLGTMTPALLSVIGFSAARFALGVAEGGNFPGAIRTVGLWHPKSERALATGIFNSGSNTGVILATITTAFIVSTMGWGWAVAFYVTGGLGFVWLVFWLAMYDVPERHPRVSPAELAHIQSDPPDPKVRIPWLALLRHRQTWAFACANFLASPIWWFYMSWTPSFLKDKHGIDLWQMSWSVLVIYLIADVGSIAGGGLSSWLIHRGVSVNVARKGTLLACAICVMPVVSVARVTNVWAAVLLIGVAAAAHQGFSANLFTIVSDTAPRKVVGSIVGIGGTAGSLGGALFPLLVGYILDKTQAVYGEKDYLIPFIMAGSAYLVATAIIHLLLPRLEPMEMELDASDTPENHHDAS